MAAPATRAGASARDGSEVAVLNTALYGSVLVVGSGVLEGYPLYEFSGDQGARLGCGTTLAHGYDLGPIASVPLTCSGPMSDAVRGKAIDDWPAFTSRGTPIAKRGVDQKLLGVIERQGIGDQVTYGGHPLYLFDAPSSPFKPQGEDYVETVHPLAPWHGYWSLVAAGSGSPAPGVATLETGLLMNGTRVLAVARDVNVRPFAVTVYTLDGGAKGSPLCAGSCTREWIALLTSGRARARSGVVGAALGVVRVAGGVEQVTYDRRPLYLYASERATLTDAVKLRTAGTAGNGEGLSANGSARFFYVTLTNH